MGNHAIPVKVLSVIQGTGQHTEGLAVGLKVLRERELEGRAAGKSEQKPDSEGTT